MSHKTFHLTLLSQAVASVLLAVAPAVHAAGFNAAVTGGKFKGVLRPRFEYVDQENISKTSKALTLRGAFQYTTGAWQGLQLRSELEVVGALGADNYNSTQNGKTMYPLVADPMGGHFNRLFLFHKGGAYEVGAGMDEIIYDNSRWVGNVGWRQNHQTFNSVKIDGQAGGISYHAAYLFSRYHVANVGGAYNGDAYYDGDDFHSSYFLNAGYGFSFGRLVGFAYSYKFDQPNGNTVNRTNTLGGSLSGTPGPFEYRLEYATQKREDAKGAGRDGTASYWHLVGGMKFGAARLLLGYEFLGSDDGQYAVKADFGTNHKFNGFADQFLSTPDAGLKDLYVTGVYRFAGNKFVASYHRFTPDYDRTFDKYGDEVDLVAVKKLNKQVSLLAKYADYKADAVTGNPKANDVQKLIVQAEYHF